MEPATRAAVASAASTMGQNAAGGPSQTPAVTGPRGGSAVADLSQACEVAGQPGGPGVAGPSGMSAVRSPSPPTTDASRRSSAFQGHRARTPAGPHRPPKATAPNRRPPQRGPPAIWRRCRRHPSPHSPASTKAAWAISQPPVLLHLLHHSSRNSMLHLF